MWYSSTKSKSGWSKLKERKCCLLIGNTRWHWAFKDNEKWCFSHTYPDEQKLQSLNTSILKWAAVGKIPKNILIPSKQIKTSDIPFLKLPKWLGVDRALGGWAAFQKTKHQDIHRKGLLLVDAGTVFSLTKFKSDGTFEGGQLIPGLQLQQYAMSKGTENLFMPREINIPKDLFPLKTEEAMLQGSFQSLIGTLLNADRQLSIPIWLCGGDSEILYKNLQSHKLDITLCPNLVLEGMVDLIN